jgi:hypothetical protein
LRTFAYLKSPEFLVTLNHFNTILTQLNLSNDDLVQASTEQLTFKQVQKARLGKPITSNIQGKITRALNACGQGHRYVQRDLFPRDQA